MPTHLPCMREDLGLLLARAPWRIPMMLPQATQIIALSRMPCQATQMLMLMRNHMRRKKVIQHTVHQCLGDNWLSLKQNRSLGLNPGEWPTAAKKRKKSRVHHINLQVFQKRDACNDVTTQQDAHFYCSYSEQTLVPLDHVCIPSFTLILYHSLSSV